MKYLFAMVLVATITISGASETETELLELQNGLFLSIKETTYSRTMPWAFYDQAVDSIPRIHPDSLIVAKKRLGTTGEKDEIIYSLVGYKISKDDKDVTVSGIATIMDRAWSFEIVVAEPTLTQTLRLILQRLSDLPYNKRMQSDRFKHYAHSAVADAGRYKS